MRLRYGALAKKILLKLSVRIEVSSVESNETTAATVRCDLAPPPQVGDAVTRRLPHHVTFLSLHSGDQMKPTFRYIIYVSHTRTVVREYCKGDDQSLWEREKFDPAPPKNPSTDGHQNSCR